MAGIVNESARRHGHQFHDLSGFGTHTPHAHPHGVADRFRGVAIGHLPVAADLRVILAGREEPRS
jgi:hypothetical protein